MLGHPLHPAIVHFPIALLLSATMADLARVAGLTTDSHIAAVLMAAGLAMGLVAMGAGIADLVKLDDKLASRAMQHASVVALAWIGYAIALYLRRETLAGGEAAPTWPAIWASVASAVVLAFGGWLGGRLVYTFGANVAKQ